MSDHGGAEQPRRYCANCGAETRPEDRFCASCGKSLAGGLTRPGRTRAGSMSGTGRLETEAAGAERPTPHTSTGTSTPSIRSSRRFLMIVLAMLGAYLVLYAIS